MWEHEIVYTDRSSKDEQLLMRPFLSETKNTNMTASWMLKFIVCFVETTHEPLHLDKWTLAYLQGLFELLFCLMQFLNMTIVRNFEVMLV
jgi:hypothetical protein